VSSDTYPVTLAEAKAQCRVDHTDEDTYFCNDLIPGVCAEAEKFLNRKLLTTTVRQYFDGFRDRVTGSSARINLAYPPVQSVTVYYLDTAGVQQTLDAGTYRLCTPTDSEAFLELEYGQSWPSVYGVSNPVWVDAVCGWTSADQVPKNIKRAILVGINDMWQERGSFIVGATPASLQKTFESLLWYDRLVPV
jgi:uncharacterized phiE125 gp8 family phage protein